MKKFVYLLLLLLLPMMASAQLKSKDGIDVKDVLHYGLNPIGLISGSIFNPDRFHMTQSYSVSFMNYGNNSLSRTMYLNTMTYQISNPLSVSLQWGIQMNNNLSSNNKLGLQPNLPFNNGLFISGAQLKYAPSENTEFKLELRQYPGSYLYGMPYIFR